MFNFPRLYWNFASHRNAWKMSITTRVEADICVYAFKITVSKLT